VVVAAVSWGAKLAAIAIGLAFGAAGVGIILFGAPIVASLNKMYQRLPGGIRYPTWSHRLLGGIIVGFGLLIAVLGAILAGREIH
jgi:uncharacterized membrane protein YidH (DUF202 family)